MPRSSQNCLMFSSAYRSIFWSWLILIVSIRISLFWFLSVFLLAKWCYCFHYTLVLTFRLGF